jgi:hypothetical protein
MPTSFSLIPGDVLAERRQQLDDDRDPGGDEARVEQRVESEDAVAQDGAPGAAEPFLVEARGADAGEHDHVADERHAVDREEDAERLGMTHRCDQSRDYAPEGNADVHPQPLQRVGRRAAHCGREGREQCRLRRPERAASDAPQRVDREGLPPGMDQRHERERHRHHRQRAD